VASGSCAYSMLRTYLRQRIGRTGKARLASCFADLGRNRRPSGRNAFPTSRSQYCAMIASGGATPNALADSDCGESPNKWSPSFSPRASPMRSPVPARSAKSASGKGSPRIGPICFGLSAVSCRYSSRRGLTFQWPLNRCAESSAFLAWLIGEAVGNRLPGHAATNLTLARLVSQVWPKMRLSCP